MTKKDELDIRKSELEISLKERELKRGPWSSPMVLTIVAALIGIVTGLVTNAVNQNAENKLEKQKFEWSLIQTAVETGDPAKAAELLKFMLSLGYLEDKRDSIKNLAENGRIPVTSFHVDRLHPHVTPAGDTIYPLIRTVSDPSHR